jgi:4a-hydroxytetrahydrobiopterin dehydratase
MSNEWTIRQNVLYRSFSFDDFVQAFSFMQLVATEAENLNHHPDWRNCYNIVEFYLSTHDAGNTVTEKDHALAAAIEEIFERIHSTINV